MHCLDFLKVIEIFLLSKKISFSTEIVMILIISNYFAKLKENLIILDVDKDIHQSSEDFLPFIIFFCEY